MKAVALKKYLPIDQVDSFLDVELPKPAPTGRQLLVAVQAIAVNPVDTKVRSGRGRDPETLEDPPRVLGWDASGVVEAVGPDATLFSPGHLRESPTISTSSWCSSLSSPDGDVSVNFVTRSYRCFINPTIGRSAPFRWRRRLRQAWHYCDAPDKLSQEPSPDVRKWPI